MTGRATILLLLALLACSGPPGWESLADPEGDVEPGNLSPAVANLADITGVEVWATDPELLFTIHMKGAARSLSARQELPALEYWLSLGAPEASAEAEPAYEYALVLRLPPTRKGGDPAGAVEARFCDSTWTNCRLARGVLPTLENGRLDVEIPRSAIPALSLPFHYRVSTFVQRDVGVLDRLHEGIGCIFSCGFGSLPPGEDVAPDVRLFAPSYARYPA